MNGYLLAFSSTYDGMAARRLLRGHCPYTLLPTPREVSASCGISLLLPEDALPNALALFAAQPDGARQVSCYRVTEEPCGNCFTPVPTVFPSP